MTITYNFLYENYIKKSVIFSPLFNDRLKFVEIITVYHKDKINISDSIKYNKEIHMYVEKLYELEMIFFEFCEVIFFISRKYFNKNNLIPTKENYDNIIKDLKDNLRNNIILKENNNDRSEKIYYEYPKLQNHIDLEILIQEKLEREDEERRIRIENKRIKCERKMMELEDLNILPDPLEENEHEENEEDSI
jgi:hypothetical protein